MKIDRQEDAEHQRYPDRHVGIAGKVEIELERVGECTEPGLIKTRRARIEGERDQRLDAVGKAGLLEQADCEDDEAAQDQMRMRMLGFLPLELRDHVLVVKDWPRDQMRKVGHEQRIVWQRVGRDLPAPGVNQERDLGERVEGDADRQQDVDRKVRAGQRVDVLGDEAGIFEDAKYEKIAGDAEGQCHLSLRRSKLGHDEEVAYAVVEGDR
ncbi:hypothetical protein ACVWZV_001974 [Bradyrhizobium sp. GM5.1]